MNTHNKNPESRNGKSPRQPQGSNYYAHYMNLSANRSPDDSEDAPISSWDIEVPLDAPVNTEDLDDWSDTGSGSEPG